MEQIQPARSRGRKKTASPKAPRQKAVRTDAEAAGVAEAPQAQAESGDFFVDGFFDVLQTVNEEPGEAAPGEGYLKLKSFETAEKMADGQATKLIVPSNIADLAGTLAAVGAAAKGGSEDR